MRRIPRSYLQLANFARSGIRSTGSLQGLPPKVLPDGGFEDHNLDTQRKPLRRLSPRGRSTE